jgi:hypothetical protein
MGNAISPGEGAEIAVKRAVFLHDHDDMLDLVDACRDWRLRGVLGRGPCTGCCPRTAARENRRRDAYEDWYCKYC